jgi:hypothetical protein
MLNPNRRPELRLQIFSTAYVLASFVGLMVTVKLVATLLFK